MRAIRSLSPALLSAANWFVVGHPPECPLGLLPGGEPFRRGAELAVPTEAGSYGFAPAAGGGSARPGRNGQQERSRRRAHPAGDGCPERHVGSISEPGALLGRVKSAIADVRAAGGTIGYVRVALPRSSASCATATSRHRYRYYACWTTPNSSPAPSKRTNRRQPPSKPRSSHPPLHEFTIPVRSRLQFIDGDAFGASRLFVPARY
jgi:hypothetical protein